MYRKCCAGCGIQIDEETCWCGEEENAHTAFSGHMFVPMGCTCFMDRPGRKSAEESEEMAQDHGDLKLVAEAALEEASEWRLRFQSIERAYQHIKAWNDAYMDAERQRQNANYRRPLSRQEEGARSVHERLAALLRLDDAE